MQIERRSETRRVIGGGFGLNYARCNDGPRLLIGTHASLVLRVHGRMVDWARRLQANTETRRPVLSTVFVGRQLLRRPDIHLAKLDLELALEELRSMILRAAAI